MLTASLFFCVALSAPPPRIVIDGRFDDWDTAATLVDDPVDAPQAAVDFGQVRVSHDDRFVHLLIEVGRPVNVQRLPGTIRVLLDSDGSVATGVPIEGLGGVDVIVELSPRNPDRGGRIGRGVGLFSTSAAEPLSPHDAGLTFALTYADTALQLLNTFILDTRDLSDRWLTHHMLQAGDTAAASDHFPLVADFR